MRSAWPVTLRGCGSFFFCLAITENVATHIESARLCAFLRFANIKWGLHGESETDADLLHSPPITFLRVGSRCPRQRHPNGLGRFVGHFSATRRTKQYVESRGSSRRDATPDRSLVHWQQRGSGASLESLWIYSARCEGHPYGPRGLSRFQQDRAVYRQGADVLRSDRRHHSSTRRLPFRSRFISCRCFFGCGDHDASRRITGGADGPSRLASNILCGSGKFSFCTGTAGRQKH